MEVVRKNLCSINGRIVKFGGHGWGTESQHTRGKEHEECWKRMHQIQMEVWGEFKRNITVSRRNFLLIEPEYQIFTRSYPDTWEHPSALRKIRAQTARQMKEMNDLIVTNRPVPTPIYGKFNTEIRANLSGKTTAEEYAENEANYAEFKQDYLASYKAYQERQVANAAKWQAEGLELKQMRAALDILYADAKVLEENAFTCLDNAYDSHVAHQATHQVSLDTARTRRADPRKLESYGAQFNKARGVWEVPAFKSLLSFMPYTRRPLGFAFTPGCLHGLRNG